MRENYLENLGWVTLWLGGLFIALACRPLMPVDETRYLSVAWEMWHSGQWLVPQSNGLPYSHKPPLLFWLIHVSWNIFGVNEWSARLIAPLFGFASLVLTQILARLLWPSQNGRYSLVPYMLLGTFFWALYSTLTLFDPLVTCFSLMCWITLWLCRQGNQWYRWSLYAAALGLGILAKGPVIFVYVLPAALLAPVWDKEQDKTFWCKWYFYLTGAVITGVSIALIWAIPAATAGGAAYADAIFFSQTAGRMVHSFAHQRPVYWYILLLPLLLFPWIFYLHRPGNSKPLISISPSRFCFSIIWPALLILSLVSGKQAHYLLPLFPIFILLIWSRDVFSKNLARLRRYIFSVFFLFLAVALLAAPSIHTTGSDNVLLASIPRWASLGPFAAAILILQPLVTYKQEIIRLAVVHTGVLLSLYLCLTQPINAHYDVSNIGASLKKATEEKRTIMVFPPSLKDQFQFAGRLTTPVIPIPTLAEAVIWCQLHPQGVALLSLTNDMYPELQSKGTAHQYKNLQIVVVPASDVFSFFNRNKETN